jgi:hypothetical protein
MSARDVRAMFHDPQFQAIRDRNSQLLFLAKYARDECFISINDRKLSEVYEISEGHIRRLRCVARKKEEMPDRPVGRPCKLTDEQERDVVERILAAANDQKFLTKREVLDEIENRYGKVLTYGWLHHFLARHEDKIGCATVHPQEDPRLQIPRTFLEQYLTLVGEHVVGVNSRLVFNIDETGCSDWEERGPYPGIVPAAMKNHRIHFPVSRRVKHQTMLVCINAAGETLCPLIVTTDRSARGVFRDGIEENVDLQVHLGTSAYVNAAVFYSYLDEVLIRRIEDFREANGLPESPAVLFMDNCSSHLTREVIDLLSSHKVKIITFPPHSSGIFQMLDLVFFGVFKTYKKRLSRNTSVPVMEDHAMRMFRACEAAGASTTVRSCFSRAGFTYQKVPEGGYILGFDESRIRGSAEFREVWEIDFPLQSLTPRRLATRWGFINAEAFRP